MNATRKIVSRALACASLVLSASVALAGCAMVPGSAPGTASAQFQITDLSNPNMRPVAAQSGAALRFPSPSSLNVKIIGAGSTGAQRMNVFVTATVPNCDGQPVPAPYRVKHIVFAQTLNEEAANSLTQDWPLSSRTLLLLGLCRDASAPEFPSPNPPPGSFRIRAQVQDGSGHWSQSDLTIQIGGAPAAS